MVTRAGSVPQVQLSAGPVQPGRDGGEDQGMGEGSVARGEGDCCSTFWFVKELADSQFSWCTPPWLPDQGEEGEVVWLPGQGGEQEAVWLPDRVGTQGTVWLPDKEAETKGIWLPDHWVRGKVWLPNCPPFSPSNLSSRRTFLSCLGGGNGVLKHSLVYWPLWRSLCSCHSRRRRKLRACEAGLLHYYDIQHKYCGQKYVNGVYFKKI